MLHCYTYTHTHGEKEKDSVWFCRIIHLFQFAFHVHKCSVFQCLFLKIFCIVSSLSVIKILWWTKSILYLSHFSCNPAAAKCEHHPFRTMPTCAYYCFYYIDTVEPKWFINFRIIIFNWILFEGDFRSKIMKINGAQIFATSNIKHKWKERKKIRYGIAFPINLSYWACFFGWKMDDGYSFLRCWLLPRLKISF